MVKAWDRYEELSALLKDDAFAILKELRYVRPTTNPERLKQIEKDAVKRAIETARYVIPIGAFTSMVHTVSGIVLHRLQRMMHTGDAPYEARVVISEMVRQVQGVGPAVLREGRRRHHRARRRDRDVVPEAARRRRRLRRASSTPA